MEHDDDLRSALEALLVFIEKDNRGLSIIRSRRDAWPKAKATIVGALLELKAQTPPFERDLWIVGGGDQFNRTYEDNFDGVQLSFGHLPTGIAFRSDGAVSRGVERGASLVFGQSESGLIVVAKYPFVTELPLPDVARPA